MHRPLAYDLAYSLLLGLDRRLWAAVLVAAGVTRGLAVLDVGCGTGRLTLEAARRVGPDGTAWGIDPSEEMIAFASKKAGGTGSAARFAVAPVERLPFDDLTFDVVLSTFVLHHLPPLEKRECMAEVLRVLKPGGGFSGFDLRVPDNPVARLFVEPWFRRHSAAEGAAGVVEPMRIAGFEGVERSDGPGRVLEVARGRRPERCA